MPHLDLLAETATRDLLHFELQSKNDPGMPLRMAEFASAIYRQYARFPRQFVLYVGTTAAVADSHDTLGIERAREAHSK
jgi:hypothetical protein